MHVRDKARWSTAVFFFLSGIITASWSSRIPDMQRQLQLTNAELGTALFCTSAGLLLGLPFSSWIITRLSSIRMMTIGTIIYALVLALVGLSQNLYMLMGTLFLFGATRNLVNMAANTNSVEVQAIFKKPIISTYHGIWSLACLIGIGIGAILIAQPVALMYHFAGMAVLAIVLVISFRRKERLRPARAEKRSFFRRPNRYLLLLGITAYCSMMCESAMFDWSINYFDKIIHADKTFVTFGYSSFIVFMTIGRLLGDKFTGWIGPFRALMVNGLLMAIGLTIVVLFPAVWSASVGFGFIGLGSSIIVPVLFSLAGKAKDVPPSFAIGSVTLIGYCGYLSSPLVVGNITEHFSMQTAFACLVFFAFMISVLAYSFQKEWWVKLP